MPDRLLLFESDVPAITSNSGLKLNKFRVELKSQRVQLQRFLALHIYYYYYYYYYYYK
jgi:hypothetical protein